MVEESEEAEISGRTNRKQVGRNRKQGGREGGREERNSVPFSWSRPGR